ncbi:chemotaxis protein [Bifidobacterium sp. DSM 109958]|uniref:Chemotaxis protein n=1 Tax=Bifidobacterium moraviense TaxID=2675323 RepID=A0A7Y0F2B5_9BIFI|nr:DUF4012 domain-containing protein [Bifidobacterium sp. DSM 109958]NMN00626.1 chemotaxis protein [Bifidobacterium sp. DSM 109958]
MHQIPRHTGRKGRRNLTVPEGWTLVAKVLYVVFASFAGLLLSTVIVYGSSVVRMTYEADRMIGSAQNLANAALGCGGDVNFADASHDLVDSAGKLRDELDTVKWTLVRDHTAYGNDITAVRTMLNAVGDLVDGPFVDLMNLAGSLSGFSMEDKTIDVSALLQVPDIVQRVHADIAQEVRALGELRQPRITAVGRVVESGRSALESVDSLLTQYDDLVSLIPSLLGADGARTYLVAIYNPAELRSGGGMVGNIAAVTADRGRVTIGDFVVTTDYQYADQPFDKQGALEAAIFGNQVYAYPQTTTVNPNFQRAAVTLKNLWQAQEGNRNTDVAGVFALDPVFMQALIGATGDVTLSDGTVLNGQNAVSFFLSDLYTKHPDFVEQNNFTNESSKRIMSSVMSNVSASTASAVLRAVKSSSSSGHFKAWMNDDRELAALVRTNVFDANVAGVLPSDPKTPTAGVYFTEAVASKLDWYLDVDVQVSRTCGKTLAATKRRLSDAVDARPRSTAISAVDSSTLGDEYTVEVTLHNMLSKEQASLMPTFVVGEDGSGTMQPRLFLMGPTGGAITSLAYESGDFVSNGVLDGHQFVNLRLPQGLAPEETVTVAFTVRVAKDASTPLNVVTTPIITADGTYTGTNGQVTDKCAAEGSDQSTDGSSAAASPQSSSSSADASDPASPSASSSSSSDATPTDAPTTIIDDQSGADTSSAGALDSLDKLRGELSCPVDVKAML